MKIVNSSFQLPFCLAGALLAGLVLAPPARAQLALGAPGRAAKSGYELFLEAGQLVKQTGAETGKGATPAELRRRGRLAVARNAPALAALRAALAQNIVLPPDFYANDAPGRANYARELARQLYQEAAVRAADGDALGAAQSDLDSFQLSRQIAGGSFFHGLVGAAVASLARKSLENHAALLSAAQCRQIAARWEQLEAQTPAFAALTRGEARASLPRLRQNIAVLDDQTKRAQAQAELDGGTLSPEDARVTREILALSVASVEAGWNALFERGAARAALPYAAAMKEAPLPSPNLYLASTAQLLSSAGARFTYERDVAANRLLAGALRLRAAKLDGAYPDKFEAGVDPFSPTLTPLIYRREGAKYLLYSVGPDGVDDGGKEVARIVIDPKTYQKRVVNRAEADSTGDILAPVF